MRDDVSDRRVRVSLLFDLFELNLLALARIPLRNLHPHPRLRWYHRHTRSERPGAHRLPPPQIRLLRCNSSILDSSVPAGSSSSRTHVRGCGCETSLACWAVGYSQ